jgi:hypothetical protein
MNVKDDKIEKEAGIGVLIYHVLTDARSAISSTNISGVFFILH